LTASPPSYNEKVSFTVVSLYTSYDKAAALAEAIINYHVFGDRNKRTALLAASAMLQLNGMCLDAPHEQEVRMMLDVAAKRVAVSELAE